MDVRSTVLVDVWLHNVPKLPAVFSDLNRENARRALRDTHDWIVPRTRWPASFRPPSPMWNHVGYRATPSEVPWRTLKLRTEWCPDCPLSCWAFHTMLGVVPSNCITRLVRNSEGTARTARTPVPQ